MFLDIIDDKGSEHQLPRGPVPAGFLAGLRARRSEIEALGRLPDDIAQGLKDLGLYRLLVPKSLGGDEIDPVSFLRVVERISAADGSAGWVASFAGAAVYLAGLPPHRFEQIYADGPDIAFAAGLFPVQPVRRRNDRLILDGRWKFASGSAGADWLGVGISVAGEGPAAKPRMIVFPRRAAELVTDWRVFGMAGTGSYDILLENVAIEADWSFVRGAGTTRREPIYRFPVIPFSALNHAIVAVGVALGALGEARGAATGATRPAAIARATASLLAGRALIYRHTALVWEDVKLGRQVSAERSGLLRIAANAAAEAAVAACHAALEMADPQDQATRADLSRHLRDVLVAGQHAFLSPAVYEQEGQVLLGRPVPPGFI